MFGRNLSSQGIVRSIKPRTQQELRPVAISSVLLNGTSFGSSPGPVINKGATNSNSFTIIGSGFSGSLLPSNITFNFPGYAPTAYSITSQTTAQIIGTFYYNPPGYPAGGETQSTLTVSVSSGGGSSPFPAQGTAPVKINSPA